MDQLAALVERAEFLAQPVNRLAATRARTRPSTDRPAARGRRSAAASSRGRCSSVIEASTGAPRCSRRKRSGGRGDLERRVAGGEREATVAALRDGARLGARLARGRSRAACSVRRAAGRSPDRGTIPRGYRRSTSRTTAPDAERPRLCGESSRRKAAESKCTRGARGVSAGECGLGEARHVDAQARRSRPIAAAARARRRRASGARSSRRASPDRRRRTRTSSDTCAGIAIRRPARRPRGEMRTTLPPR